MFRKKTHHPLLALAPAVSSVSPWSCHRHQGGLSQQIGLSGDEASYSSAHQTQGSENPSPWTRSRAICAFLWSGYLRQCCLSVHPPRPQSEELLGQYKPSPQKKPRSSWPDLASGLRYGRVKTSGPVPQAGPFVGGEGGADRDRSAGAGARWDWGRVLWGIQSCDSQTWNTVGLPLHPPSTGPGLAGSPWSDWGPGWETPAPESWLGSAPEPWGRHSSLRTGEKRFC